MLDPSAKEKGLIFPTGSLKDNLLYGRGGWIRTNGCRDQNPVPYHLATPLMRQNFNGFSCLCQENSTKNRTNDWSDKRIFMAGAAGFEPTDAEIKTRCLTTWRRP